MKAEVWDATPLSLGEGPLWHPGLGQLFWFDILKHRLYSREDGVTRHWQFDEHVSAAAWVSDETLLIASETRLFTFEIASGRQEDVCQLEADQGVTRSNDGRADPWGGFWIGTMGKASEPGAGAIYRYYRGELTTLYPDITVSNAICFAPDGACAYFSDTETAQIMRQRLSPEDGWPEGAPEVFVDLRDGPGKPDGAVVDAAGNLWNAQWSGGRVACYSPDGAFLHAVEIAAAQSTCPAFGGPDLSTLYCTSARAGLSADALARVPEHGMTFAVEGQGAGQAEHRVVL